MEKQIRGEYWIVNGYPQSADIEVNDTGHEGIAINDFYSGIADDLQSLVDTIEKQYDVSLDDLGYGKCDFYRYGEIDIEKMEHTFRALEELLTQERVNQPKQYIAQHINATDPDKFDVIFRGAKASDYMMKHENWIAVRSNYVTLYGMNPQKMKELISGLEEIMVNDEGIPYGTCAIEFYIEDMATHKPTSIIVGKDNSQPDQSNHAIYRPIMPNSKGLIKFNYPKGPDLQKQINKATGIPHYRTQESMDFKGWLLKELTITTACIAGFSRPVGIGVVKRKFPKRITNEF